MVLTRQALPGMLARRRGHVVNIASLAGKTTPPSLATYVATKHGVVGFTHSLRAEHGRPRLVLGDLPRVRRPRGDVRAPRGRPPGPPWYLKPFPPERVGEAVISAIRDDRAEVIVNERSLKWLVALSSLAPGLMARPPTPRGRGASRKRRRRHARGRGNRPRQGHGEKGAPRPKKGQRTRGP